MKLELKHLAPYLPYGLKLNTIENEMYLIDFESKKIESKFRGNLINIYDYDDVKPILRPLSDLTKEIEHNGEKFVPFDILSVEFQDLKLKLYQIEDGDSLSISIKTFAYLDIEILPFLNKLHEWHFDTQNLIENGLAIDINTLNETTRHQTRTKQN